MSKETETESQPKAQLDNVFFVIGINGKEVGKVEFKLYDDICPKTTANFRALCTGVKTDGEVLPKGFGYKGTPFHRVIPGFMVQGGDFEKGDGTGGQSIYGDKFPDENFTKKHDQPGLLSCANCGPNTNGSQFFITTAEKCDWLDGKHTVFGEVVSGLSVIREIESRGNKEGKPPKDKIIVISCGAVPPSEKTDTEEDKKDKDENDNKEKKEDDKDKGKENDKADEKDKDNKE